MTIFSRRGRQEQLKEAAKLHGVPAGREGRGAEGTHTIRFLGPSTRYANFVHTHALSARGCEFCGGGGTLYPGGRSPSEGATRVAGSLS